MEKCADEKKMYKSRWSTAEETTLVQAVLERESRLFGSMVGCGSTKHRLVKEAAWEEVASLLNTQFFAEKRDAKSVKKKYYNLKGKAKSKNDAKTRTGGGPAESFSQAEALLLDTIGSRASVCGISSSVDTDGQSSSFSCPEGGKKERSEELVFESEPALVVADTANQRKDCELVASLPRPTTNSSTQKRGMKRKSIFLAEETLTLDKERITLEIELLKEKIKSEKIKNSMLQKKEIKLDLKIQTLRSKEQVLSLKKELLSLKIKGSLDFDFS